MTGLVLTAVTAIVQRANRVAAPGPASRSAPPVALHRDETALIDPVPLPRSWAAVIDRQTVTIVVLVASDAHAGVDR